MQKYNQLSSKVFGLVLFGKIFNLVYSPDDGASDDGTGDDGAGDKDTGDKDTGDKGKKVGKTFTQDDVNKLLASEKREHQARTQRALDELNALKSKANITTKERQELEGRIDELNNALLTKDEIAKKDALKLQKKFEVEVAALSTDRETWRNRYTESTIMRSITDAAVEHKALVPSQIVAILRPSTRLIEAVDEEGKPNGKFDAKVKLEDVNDKGEPVTLDLTVAEAVKRMREMETHQNLFQSDGAGGLGSQNRSGSKGKTVTLADAAKQGPEAYRKARKLSELNLTK